MQIKGFILIQSDGFLNNRLTYTTQLATIFIIISLKELRNIVFVNLDNCYIHRL
ncbi:hypothetical protein D3C86_1445280 [compost metagenome]